MFLYLNHELWESLYSYILIKLSLYQHLCCIVSLIASFCSIKSPIFAVLSIFLHAFCQLFVLLTVRPLNQNTTDAQRKPRKNRWEDVFRFLGNDQLSQSGCWKYNGNCIEIVLSPLGKARKYELASYIIFSPLKLSPRLTRFFDRSCGRTRRRRLPKCISLTFLFMFSFVRCDTK